MATKTDRRIIQTKEKIKTGFLSLIEQKPVEKVTVKEICEKSGITRGTFYAHYENEYDLLKTLTVELISNAFDMINDLPGKKHSEEEKINILSRMFDYLKDNRTLLWYFVNRNVYSEITAIARDFFNKLCLTKSVNADADRIDAAYMYTGCGIKGLFNFWINEDFNISSKKLAICFKSIIDGGIKEFIQSTDI